MNIYFHVLSVFIDDCQCSDLFRCLQNTFTISLVRTMARLVLVSGVDKVVFRLQSRQTGFLASIDPYSISLLLRIQAVLRLTYAIHDFLTVYEIVPGKLESCHRLFCPWLLLVRL